MVMFNRLREKPLNSVQRYRIGQRLPIRTANALLNDKRYAFYIEQVKRLTQLPNEHFEHFYLAFIERFAEFVQVIPETRDAPLGTLLSSGLLRGLNTLDVFVTQFGDPTPLERYALFTACVLRDIGRVITQQKIFITGETGITVKHWQPFCGPMTEEIEGDSFKIIPLSTTFERLNRSVRLTLARQVMGENGFLAIASDLRLFMEWLEALEEEDEDGNGRLVCAIKLYRREGGGLMDGLPLAAIEILDSPDTEHADVFYTWLITGLEDGSIKTNTSDSLVHLTELGVFVEMPGIFKQFTDLYNVPVNQFVLFTQIGNLLGVPAQGGDDHHHTQLFGKQKQLLSDYPDANGIKSGLPGLLTGKQSVLREGVLLDVNTVFINKSPPDITPYIKTSAKSSYASLSQYNQVTKPNHTLRIRG